MVTHAGICVPISWKSSALTGAKCAAGPEELLRSRHCTVWPEWHHLIADHSVADALLDRLVHRAVRLELKGGSMRKEAPKRPRKST